VVAAHDQVAAAEVLAEHRVEQGLPRTPVAHLEGHAGLDAGVLDEIVADERVHRAHPDLGGDVARLELAQDLLDEHAVADLHGDLGEVLVGTVHRIAELERRHRAPALVGEEAARLLGPHVETPVPLGIRPLAQHRDGAGEVDLALAHDVGDAGMGGIRGPEDLLALVRAIDRVLLPHQERRHRLAHLAVDERDLLAFREAPRVLARGRERDRDRPEHAVGQPELVADGLPVPLAHEAVERREGADAQHDEVGRLTRRDGEPGQARGPPPRLRQRLAARHERPEPLVSSVWIHQWHVPALFISPITTLAFHPAPSRCGEERVADPDENAQQHHSRDQAPPDEPLLRGEQRLPRLLHLVANPRLLGHGGLLPVSRAHPAASGGLTPWKKSHETTSPIQMMKPKRHTM
jgi:hypothetical protein